MPNIPVVDGADPGPSHEYEGRVGCSSSWRAPGWPPQPLWLLHTAPQISEQALKSPPGHSSSTPVTEHTSDPDPGVYLDVAKPWHLSRRVHLLSPDPTVASGSAFKNKINCKDESRRQLVASSLAESSFHPLFPSVSLHFKRSLHLAAFMKTRA